MAVQFQTEEYLLRAGDTVLLHSGGYVYSQLTSEMHNSVALCKADSTDKLKFNLPNIHFAAFKIVRANKFKAQERLNNYKKSLRGKEATGDKSDDKLQRYDEEVKLETMENEVEEERMRGTEIVYGEKVQLLHILSKKYVTVNTTKISKTENTNLLIELTPQNGHGCIFKLLPRYKVRSVGDKVHYNDKIKFESVTTEGQFLHCSSTEFGNSFPVLGKSLEVNLSATTNTFTLIPHYRPNYDQPCPKALKGGDVVELFHREEECYVSAEGSFANSSESAVVEDVHCRKHRGRFLEQSTSANVYWQFEKESNPCSGEPFSWGERCRIKHLPTRRYLRVTKNSGVPSVCLTESSETPERANLETIFTLSPVILEGNTIVTESYARIKHLQTNTWLHLTSKHYERHKVTGTLSGSGTELWDLKWDYAQLYQLTAEPTMYDDDAFTLERVSEDLLHKFNYVAGIVPVLTTYIAKYDELHCLRSSRRDVQPGVAPDPRLLARRRAHLTSVEGALSDLDKYLDKDRFEVKELKNRQKLLRILKVLDLLIKILKVSSLSTNPDISDDTYRTQQSAICKCCYTVIERYLWGHVRKNENYLARFIPFFMEQVKKYNKSSAVDVMIEMVKDNDAIIARMVEQKEHFIDKLIKLLLERKDHRFMDFLGMLCVSLDRPTPKTQNTILEDLVEKHGDKVFYRFNTDEQPRAENHPVWCIKKPDSTALIDIPKNHTATEFTDKFLESQLGLFAKLCKGNNAKAINVLGDNGQGWISFELVLQCAKNSKLHSKLRSKFVELMIVMYVDVGENRDLLEHLSLSFVYEKIEEEPYKKASDDPKRSLTGASNDNFPAIRDWIMDYISDVTKKENRLESTDYELLADVLAVLKQLVVFGYYVNHDDVKKIQKLLNKLIEDELQNKEVKEAKKRAVFEVKKRSMEVMELLLNFRFYVHLQRIIFLFKSLRKISQGEEVRENILPDVNQETYIELMKLTEESREKILKGDIFCRLSPEKMEL